MNIIVFSKNRAAQLDLFLRSFNKYVNNSDKYEIKVLYTYSDKEFKKGYNIVLEKYKNVKFILEKDFKTDLMDLIYSLVHTVFFVDDNLFVRDFDFCDQQQFIFESDKNILCRSLRLNYYLTYCYPAKKVITSVPSFDTKGSYYWKSACRDYNYPMSLDGHIFRTQEILPLLKTLKYKNPNTLEGILSQNPINKPKIICYPDSKIINMPINKVQTQNRNICGKIDAAHLNRMFIAGHSIRLEFENIKNIACHLELGIKYDIQKRNF